MKPLLRRAPLTDEDWAVWLRFENRPGWYGYGEYVAADRRDAALMLKLVLARVGWRALFKCFGPRVNPAGFDQVGEGPDAVPIPALRL